MMYNMVYTKGELRRGITMIRMLKDMSLYLPNDSEFTFRRGYSYLSEVIDGKTYVMTVDRELKMELDEEDMKWIEVV